MKKVMLMLACVLFAASSASAMTFGFDPAELANLTTVNSATDAGWASFSASDLGTGLDLDADTVSTITGLNISDDGFVWVNSLKFDGLGDDAGLGTTWGLIGGWTNLTGKVTATGYVYDAGAVFSLYAYQAVYGSHSNGGDIGLTSADYGNDLSELQALNAVKVADLELVSGFGGPATIGNTLELYWEFTYLAPGFWVGPDGVTPLSLSDIPATEYLQFFADTKTPFEPIVVGNQVFARHHVDGYIDVVPEPATMALFGTGLFGLAGARLRRKQS